MAAWPRYVTLVGLAVVLIFLSLIYGYRFGLVPLMSVFGGMRMLVPVLLIASLATVAASGALFFRRTFLAGFAALAVAASAGVLGMVPLWMSGEAKKVPPIHDITTDTMDPPVFVDIVPLRADASNPPAYDPGQTEQQLEAYPHLRPLVMPVPIQEAFVIAQDAVRAEGLTLVASVPEEGRIEAYARTPLFDFKDDVVIRLRDAHGTATVIDIRSKSRVGRSDLGFNARRIDSLIEKMEAKGGRLDFDHAPVTGDV
ncbi:MAG: DUF1499 domain-containing protein [Pseudomonadota bacterium]